MIVFFYFPLFSKSVTMVYKTLIFNYLLLFFTHFDCLKIVSNEFITHLKMSNCGKYLAIGTIENTIVICNLLPAIQLNCKLPKYSLKNVTITAMAIHPKSNNLIVAYSNHKVSF